MAAVARFEEVAGELRASQQLGMKGCEEYSKSEDIWLEAYDVNKSRVLKEAIKHVPGLESLWKALANLNNGEDERMVLHKVVLCCTINVELWVNLASLIEANGNTTSGGKIIERGIQTWQEVSLFEQLHGNVLVARTIFVKACVELLDSKEIFLDAARFELKNGMPMKENMLLAKARELVAMVGMWIKCVWIERMVGGDAERFLYEWLVLFSFYAELWKMRDMMEFRHNNLEGLEELNLQAIEFHERGKWKALVETETWLKVKCLRSDNGGEYELAKFKEF
ncbi:protein STABILIZED1-like [Salvia splendens]|uniref:protein STABILIZED1-like n=1 Tax=Salvia splendens TaxID=180675 RepID=UPI001C2603B6|nr:protein STABILIZED1-like [Salvia splendens]